MFFVNFSLGMSFMNFYFYFNFNFPFEMCEINNKIHSMYNFNIYTERKY